MFNSKFSQVKSSLHNYSRSPLAKDQLWLDQATAPAGHTVMASQVRAEEIPVIQSIAIRDRDFLVGEDGSREVGGSQGHAFKNVIKFVEGARLQPIPETNNEAYLIVDSLGSPYKNFIAPSDKPINQYTLSEGYEVRILDEAGTPISQNYGWAFDAFTGIVHFSPELNPSSPAWPFGTPSVEGFVYIGKFVSNVVDSLNQTAQENADSMASKMIAIQPFKFSSSEMTPVGAPYQIENTVGGEETFQKLSFVIPGYVFELTSLDKNETILTDIRHLDNGDSEILIDLPWNVQYSWPVIRYSYDSGEDGVGSKTDVIGRYHFLATAFVARNGEKIPLNPVKNLEEGESEYDDGFVVQPSHPALPPPFGSRGMHISSDDDVIVNIFNK